MKLNNKGIGKTELMITLTLIIVLTAIILQIFLNRTDKRSFANLRKMANKFAVEAAIVRNEDARLAGVVYLADLLKLSDSSKLEKYKSPFSSNNCDFYESKIYNYKNEKRVSFRCDDYVIIDHNLLTKKEMMVKVVGPWKASDNPNAKEEMQAGNIEVETFYNVETADGPLFEDFFSIRKIVDKYNEAKGKDYFSLDQVRTDAKVITKDYYRTIDEAE